ncbi:zinc finger protein, putative [Plasmodium sp. gorilla clade G3]|nr:zinc finger protein, putative [Plasmodium sp. gorilla clade G3]
MSILSLFHICSPFLRSNCLEKEEIYENFICSVCLDLCDTPVITLCNHICCYKCMYYSLLHKRNCPICKQIIKHNNLKKITGKQKKEYEEIRIKCHLCNEKIKIKDYKRHINTCEYKRCKNYILGCEYYDKKSKIKLHEQSCEHRLISCSSCSNLFYFKNRIFMLTLKEKYQLNMRFSFTYYSFYYNLIMNTNFKRLHYLNNIKHDHINNHNNNNYISRKINILKNLQHSLDHILCPSVSIDTTTTTSSNHTNSMVNKENTYIQQYISTNNVSRDSTNINFLQNQNPSAINNRPLNEVSREIYEHNDHHHYNNNNDYDDDNNNIINNNNNNRLNSSYSMGYNNISVNPLDHISNESREKRRKKKATKINKYNFNDPNSKSRNNGLKYIDKLGDVIENDNSSNSEEFLNILPLRKNFNFKDKNSKDIITIIEELFQFDNIDLSNIYIDNREFFLCDKSCFTNTIKKLRQELERSLVLLYFCCCVGMPVMFTLGCISYVVTKGFFKFSYIVTNTIIKLSHKFFLKIFNI